MTQSFKTWLTLLTLDVGATIGVFNVISHYRGVSAHFILGPLTTPVIVLVTAIYLIDGYRSRTNMLRTDYTSLHLIAVAAAMILVLLITFVFLPAGFELQSSRGVIALSFLALMPITLGGRQMLQQSWIAPRTDLSLLFIGEAAECDEFRRECGQMGMHQPVVFAEVGLLPQKLQELQAGSHPLEAIVFRESHWDLAPTTAQALVQLYFRGIPTYPLELFHQVYWQKIPLYRLNPAWLFQEGFQIAREPVFERLKRASDIALASIGLVLAAPIVAVAAAAVWLEDRGPIWFAQNRIGRNHQTFRLYKLRSMRPSDGQGDPYTRPGDGRITRVGRLLRMSRCDELPQLWNVLRGEMSLIGPRAEWDRLVDEYDRQIPCYRYRHLVKPGITGWAQVNYRYGANLEDTIRKLEYDLYYIRHFSFLLDASIVLKTVQIMLLGRGR
jgi:lipopolysaccharide/colanic/teichoic acid biosynthesis glycosyltransferase